MRQKNGCDSEVEKEPAEIPISARSPRTVSPAVQKELKIPKVVSPMRLEPESEVPKSVAFAVGFPPGLSLEQVTNDVGQIVHAVARRKYLGIHQVVLHVGDGVVEPRTWKERSRTIAQLAVVGDLSRIRRYVVRVHPPPPTPPAKTEKFFGDFFA
jgi:hypothetical protein